MGARVVGSGLADRVIRAHTLRHHNLAFSRTNSAQGVTIKVSTVENVKP